MLLHAGSSRSVQPDDWTLSDSSEADQEDNAWSIHSVSGISSVFVARPVQSCGVPKPTESPTPLRAQSPVAIRCFALDAHTDDHRNVSEVGELLRIAARLLPDGYLVHTIQIVYASLDVMH